MKKPIRLSQFEIEAIISELNNSMEHHSNRECFADFHYLNFDQNHKDFLMMLYDEYWKLGPYDRLHYSDPDWERFIDSSIKKFLN